MVDEENAGEKQSRLQYDMATRCAGVGGGGWDATALGVPSSED